MRHIVGLPIVPTTVASATTYPLGSALSAIKTQEHLLYPFPPPTPQLLILVCHPVPDVLHCEFDQDEKIIGLDAVLAIVSESSGAFAPQRIGVPLQFSFSKQTFTPEVPLPTDVHLLPSQYSRAFAVLLYLILPACG
jgi:hypothetical protein